MHNFREIIKTDEEVEWIGRLTSFSWTENMFGLSPREIELEKRPSDKLDLQLFFLLFPYILIPYEE